MGIVGELSKTGGLDDFTSETGENQPNSTQDDVAIPLIEILETDDVSSLSRYTNRFDSVLVDTPIYHTKNQIATEDDDNSASFHNEHTDAEIIPVVSQRPPEDGPIEYTSLLNGVNELSERYDRIAIRPIIETVEFTPRQKNTLKEVADTLSNTDIVLPDVFKIEKGIGAAYLNIQTLFDYFERQPVYILNAFDPHNGGRQAHNYGPLFASMVPADGFGDYLLERREMPGGPVTTSNRVIRYYDEEEFERIRITGEGYSGAAKELKDTDYLDETHCNFCRQAVRGTEESRTFWKQFQMGHYVQSAVNHLGLLEQYSGEELDMDGFSTLRKHIGDNDGN